MQQTNNIQKIGFGGGCHWCTEAYFQHLRGVSIVEQGWIGSDPPHENLSEGVIVRYDPMLISLSVLVSIHLYTHACTKAHRLRNKYRSAVYVFAEDQFLTVKNGISAAQQNFAEKIITLILPFKAFRRNTQEYLNYFQKNREGVFCERYIRPKLEMLREHYPVNFQESTHLPSPDWRERLLALPAGYSEIKYSGKKYGVTRRDFNSGKCIKVYAGELGGSHFISFNYYITEKGGLLKPCEMPAEDVIDFLEQSILPDPGGG